MIIRNDPLGAFMDYPAAEVASAPEGPLRDLSVAVKDVFDVAGYRTGCGNPTRLEDSPVAAISAVAVQRVLDAGARFAGKTLTDELAFSLNGINAHYGTPVNARAPQRIPGGSSSGSASATAGGLVDFAMGTDTGGSIRAPASYCGLYGLRITHGRIPLDGVMPLAPSFDTVGWFARDAQTYRRVGAVMLGADAEPRKTPGLLVAGDAFELMLDGPGSALAGPLKRVETVLGKGTSVRLTENGLTEWLDVFRICQGHEIWRVHADWITSRKPDFGPGVRERFEWAAGVTDDAAAEAQARRVGFRERTAALLGDDHVLVLPTVPGVAPLKVTPISEIEIFRNRALSQLCISGLTGLPQMSLPLGEWEGAPLGLSLIGPARSDHLLMDLAVAISANP